MENRLSKTVDETGVEPNDSICLLMPAEDARSATYDPSSNSSTEADTAAVETPFLLEISADKKRIAHVVEISKPNRGKQYSLRIQSITHLRTGPAISKDILEKDITEYMQFVDEFTYSFLSLSSNGDRVALSFCQFDSDGELTSKRPTCSIFCVGGSGFELKKQIKSQGKAIFTLEDSQLAIISKDILNLYNCKDDYKYASSLDIKHLFPRDEQMQEETHPGAFQLFWNGSFNGPLRPDYRLTNMPFLLQAILHLTRFVGCNFLVPCFQMFAGDSDLIYEGVCVWSLADGAKSIPFKTDPSEEVMAISADKTLVATFGKESPYLDVYHIKSGLLVSRLKSDKNIRARKQFPLGSWLSRTLHFAQFSKDNEYVFLISIHGGINKKNPKRALFMVEMWSRNTEKLIYRHEEGVNVDWFSRNALQPYIVESSDNPLNFTAVYTTISKHGVFEVKSLNLVPFKDAASEHWVIEPLPRGPTDIFMRRVCVMSLQTKSDSTRYQLCFGKHAVELWRLRKSGDQETKDLMYIRAFKPPRNHQGEAFKESWVLQSYEEDGFAIQGLDRLSSIGIRFTKTRYRIIVSIKYNGSIIQKGRLPLNNATTHQEEIYLPLDKLQRGSTQQEFLAFVGTDFHYVESACRALHFFHRKRDKIKSHEVLELVQQTKRLVRLCITEMKKEKSRYFTTISGSNTLAMLASFQDGRDIIFEILQTDDLPINVISYVRILATAEKMGEFVDRNENALTILIEKFDYELFDLLFNRILLSSPKAGVGAFCAITETLIFLQGRGETTVFQNSCRKLKYLAMKSNVQQIEKPIWNPRVVMTLKVLHMTTDTDFSGFSSHATLEQISRHKSAWSVHARRDLWRFYLGVLATIQQMPIIKSYYDRKWLRDYYNSSVHDSLISECAVPFIHFSSYTIFWEDVEFDPNHDNRDDNTLTAKLCARFRELLRRPSTKERIAHKAESDLMLLASKQHENDLFHQKGSVIEVLLYCKWKTFLRPRFYIVCFIHLVYYLFFIFGVLFARERFAYSLGASLYENSWHVVVIALMFTMNLILSIQELRQFLKFGFWRYIKSIYNIIDLAALVAPPVCFWLMITASSNLDEVSAITTIILWMHGILRLRPFASIGVTLETMIQLMKSVYKTLVIMLVVIFAFTHAFMVLLLHKDDSYFQEQYSGSINLTDSESTVSYSDASASNSFTNLFKAFSTLWLFIYGVWDPITDGDAGDDFMIIVFAMLFSFVTVLLFFNLVIALMSSKAEEVKALGKSIWLSHFAEVIAEIEQFWCTRSERVNRNNSPSVVYYVAKYTDVRQHAETLEQECDDLINELRNKLKKRQAAGRSTQR